MKNEIKIGSLFSGIGGIELGFSRVGGFRTEWFVERDDYATKVLRKNYPGIPIYKDVTKVKWRKVPRIDILTGGFPCQDISVCNTKAEGIKGKRSGLWKHYAKAIGILRPKVALIENVPMLSRRGLNVVLADLAKMRYDAVWFDLRASDFGFPHIRERLFIVAYSMHNNIWKQRKKGNEKENVANSSSGRIPRIFQEVVKRFAIVNEKISERDVERWYNELSESAFLGTGHGLPKRVDRIRCIGNAVVPKKAEFIAESIKECLTVGDFSPIGGV